MDTRDGHVGQPGENIGEPSLWIDVVHFDHNNQSIHSGRSLTAALGACEEPRLSAQGHAAQGEVVPLFRTVLQLC